MHHIKPSNSLSELIKKGLMTQCGTEIKDIIVHHITDHEDGSCELSLEVHKTINTIVEGSEPQDSIVFKNLKLQISREEN